MSDYENTTIEDVTLNIVKQKQYSFGPNLRVINSRLYIDSDFRGFSVYDTTFLRCSVNIKKLQNFRWCRSRIIDCEFTGRLVGNDFGDWPEAYLTDGSIQGTNFQDAILDGVRFLRCDMESILLPRWPCFSIFNPTERVKAIKSRELSASFSNIWVDGISENPSFTSGITWHAPTVAKSCRLLEADLKSYLSNFDFIVM